MELKVLKAVRGKKWVKGDTIHVSREYAKKLISKNQACLPGDYLEKIAVKKIKEDGTND
jgi:hypothetical protein